MRSNLIAIILSVAFVTFPLGEVFAHVDKIDSISPSLEHGAEINMGETGTSEPSNAILPISVQDTTKDATKLNATKGGNKSSKLAQCKKYISVFDTYKNDFIIILFLCLVSLFAIILSVIKFTGIVKDEKKRNTLVNTLKQVIIISIIVLVCFLSDSSWAFLALVILCVLYLDKYNPGLLSKFSKAAAAIQGKDVNVSAATQADVNDKLKMEVTESKTSPVEAATNVATAKGRVNKKTQGPIELKESGIAPYEEAERLALDYLGTKYQNLQRQVVFKLGAHDKIVFDGFAQNEEENIIVEVKYCSKYANGRYHLGPLYMAAERIKQLTKKRTTILLFIVTDDKITQHRLQEIYNLNSLSDNLLQVIVSTKTELKKESMDNTSRGSATARVHTRTL